MISFDASLANLVKKNVLTKEEAESKSLNPDAFHKEMEQLSKSG
jgi:Tfp pilus assembly pilus retraction ATPase PilT